MTDTVELLTDIDVLGVAALEDGRLHRSIFDCKSSTRMSPINRAFWTVGVRQYVAADTAFVIMGNRASRNHRLAALELNVDLHDEETFIALGRSLDPAFPSIEAYQSSIDRWQALESAYAANRWAEPLREQIAFAVPLSSDHPTVFRRILAGLRSARGAFDPAKPPHIGILFDVMSATLVSLIKITRDLRRIFDPKMDRREFEKALRYYLWGGKDSYQLRQQLASRTGLPPSGEQAMELPAWPMLVNFLGLALDAPGAMFDCAVACKELALRSSTAPDAALDNILKDRLKAEGRTAQFSVALAEYLVKAGNFPSDASREIEGIIYSF